MAATETATMDDKDEDLSKPDDQTDPTEKSDENENGIEEMETSISDACDPEDVKEDDKDEDLSKPDDQSDPTEKSDENENGIVEMESSISDACDPEDVKEESTVTQQTETNPTDSVNVIIEHVKEESDTSLTIIDVNVNEDLENEVEKTDTELQKGIEHNDEELNAVRKNTVETIENAAIETVKSTEVPTSTEATDNESENSSKLVNPLKRKRSRPPKRKRKPKIHRVTKETALTETVTMMTLGQLANWEPPDQKLFYKGIIAIIHEYFPKTWRAWQVCAVSYDELFGNKISSTDEARIRFALPTVDLARAYNANGLLSLKEQNYKEMKRIPLGRALIFSPSKIMKKIHPANAFNGFADVIQTLKCKIISRKDAVSVLKEHAAARRAAEFALFSATSRKRQLKQHSSHKKSSETSSLRSKTESTPGTLRKEAEIPNQDSPLTLPSTHAVSSASASKTLQPQTVQLSNIETYMVRQTQLLDQLLALTKLQTESLGYIQANMCMNSKRRKQDVENNSWKAPSRNFDSDASVEYDCDIGDSVVNAMDHETNKHQNSEHDNPKSEDGQQYSEDNHSNSEDVRDSSWIIPEDGNPEENNVAHRIDDQSTNFDVVGNFDENDSDSDNSGESDVEHVLVKEENFLDFSEPHTELRTADEVLVKQGANVLRLGTDEWRKIPYNNVEKELEASPCVITLKINSDLAAVTQPGRPYQL
ncbi:Uncharacterized protein OBRU01_00197 [Operophtera brumata]|uniref:Uncharacterized protein n=1 Tax=Operophtera brumata TaxID=104452 RepID=A0A0L7LVH0_OPEBR|nr:Uncharacterized protein OBRU01_00197 [Operophtera brumata]